MWMRADISTDITWRAASLVIDIFYGRLKLFNVWLFPRIYSLHNVVLGVGLGRPNASGRLQPHAIVPSLLSYPARKDARTVAGCKSADVGITGAAKRAYKTKAAALQISALSPDEKLPLDQLIEEIPIMGAASMFALFLLPAVVSAWPAPPPGFSLPPISVNLPSINLSLPPEVAAYFGFPTGSTGTGEYRYMLQPSTLHMFHSSHNTFVYICRAFQRINIVYNHTYHYGRSCRRVVQYQCHHQQCWEHQ